MTILPRVFPIYTLQKVDSESFIEYWSAQYPLKNEKLYQSNIRKPLTPERIIELFKWKNGGPIAARKLKSITENYIVLPPSPPESKAENQIDFIRMQGGAIWRIFWLHCCDPDRYPIFDQHVYRAMEYLLKGEVRELPNSNKAKARLYVEQYLPFHAAFGASNGKLLDQALWSFGKHLKSKKAR